MMEIEIEIVFYFKIQEWYFDYIRIETIQSETFGVHYKDTNITRVLDDTTKTTTPLKTCRCSQRPGRCSQRHSDLWFDAECREMKKLVRSLERYVFIYPLLTFVRS